ncbi:MAG: SMC-Scp complex subunit ScpB [Candidatus Lokiarchaeota archaeon]|nr:SMC-Scp complex subunit ScpB [Candidatus Lokiarchaeota archaeon]
MTERKKEEQVKHESESKEDKIEVSSQNEDVQVESKMDISINRPDAIERVGEESLEEDRELSSEDIENIDSLLDNLEEDEENSIERELDKEQDDEVKVISVKDLTEKTIKRNTIEAALLAAQRPISIEEISIKLDLSKTEIEKLIQELAEDYMDRTTAIEIVQIGEGYAMQIKPEYTEKIVKFASGGLIPKAVMRTLTIIAVKQPLLKSLLVKMRGSTAYEHCKFLIDRGYVTSYNKGRSSVLETTDQFADTFGLSRDTETLKKQLIDQLDIQAIEESPEENEDSESHYEIEEKTELQESELSDPNDLSKEKE